MTPKNVALPVAVKVTGFNYLPVGPNCADAHRLGRIWRPFNSQIATAPVLASRQSKSPLPSPLKSPVPTMVQLLGTVPKTPGLRDL